MRLGAAGLKEQPFRVHGRPLAYVPYASRQAALDFLHQTVSLRSGLGLFLGPALSGKTTILHSFVDSLGRDDEVAIIDGTGSNATSLLEGILVQYGFQVDLNSVSEHLNMLKVFVMQRMASGRPPILIIENVHAMNPSAFRVVCELAEVKVRGECALRIVLSSDRLIDTIIQSPIMEGVKARMTGEFHLGPMNEYETTDYLYEKLRSGGCSDPQNVIPEPLADKLHKAAGGWPGVLDRLVLLALAKANHCPLKAEHIERPLLPNWESTDEEEARAAAAETMEPQLYLTFNGRTLKRQVFEGDRLIIGRAEHNDLQVDSQFISRHHALMIRQGATTLLMDLNSTNGTFVNSRRISNQVVMHNDVISIGNHRIKFVHAGAKADLRIEHSDFSDTMIMKSLQDMRSMLAAENTQALPAPRMGGKAN